MKLIYDSVTGVVTAEATDSYSGPDPFVSAPEGFEWNRRQAYSVVDGVVQYNGLGHVWEQIKAIRDDKIMNGGYQTGGKWYHSNLVSRTQQLGLLQKSMLIQMAGGDLDAPYAGTGPNGHLYWKTMDGSFVVMTGNLARAIFLAAEAQDGALHANAEALWAQALAAEDPFTVNLYQGWPTTYSE